MPSAPVETRHGKRSSKEGPVVPVIPSDAADWTLDGKPRYPAEDATLDVPGYDPIDLNDGTEF